MSSLLVLEKDLDYNPYQTKLIIHTTDANKQIVLN